MPHAAFQRCPHAACPPATGEADRGGWLTTSTGGRTVRRVVKTAATWAARCRGGVDRSSAPHRQPSHLGAGGPQDRAPAVEAPPGPVQIADRLGMQASTVFVVLVRCRLNRHTHVDRATGEPIRRYEHERPGDLIHVDVKKLGNVPGDGGWRYVRRQQGDKNRAVTPAAPKPPKQVPPAIGRDLLPGHRHRRLLTGGRAAQVGHDHVSEIGDRASELFDPGRSSSNHPCARRWLRSGGSPTSAASRDSRRRRTAPRAAGSAGSPRSWSASARRARCT